MNDIIFDARNELIGHLEELTPGSDELLKHAQAIKILSEAYINERRLEFEIEKEETRKLEKSNELIYSEAESELRKIEIGIRLLDLIINPGARLLGIFMNNRVRVKRDIMGYTFEETGVIGSHTFNNAQKDKYD